MAKMKTIVAKAEIPAKETKIKKIEVKEKVKAKKTGIKTAAGTLTQKDLMKVSEEINSLSPKSKAVVMEMLNVSLDLAVENLTLKTRIEALEKAMKDKLAVVRVEAKKTSTTGTSRAKKTRKSGAQTIS